MQRRQLLLGYAAFLIACGSEGASTELSTEVGSSGPATTIALLAATTTEASPSTTPARTTSAPTTTSTQPSTTTTPTTTTTRVPTTTTTQVATTTTATTTTTTPAPTTTTSQPAAVITITATNFAFSPSSVNIKVGDTVQWVLGSGSHTTTSGIAPSPDGGWDQSITGPVAIVFTQPGQFNFFCRFHPDSMQGAIVVS